MMYGAPYSTLPQQKQQEIVQRFMALYHSNPKGRGYANSDGLEFTEGKSKWTSKIKWIMGPYGEHEWHEHLAGNEALGLGPNLDDGTAYWACMDIDKIGGDPAYDVDYASEMEKVTKSKLPLVVDRTKSGGLRLTVYFTEPVHCETIRGVLNQWMAQLGYAKNEIFPKQSGKLEDKDDCPSWVFMPYGPTWDRFAEQCCMTEWGNVLSIEDSLSLRESRRITEKQFLSFVTGPRRNKNANGDGTANPRRRKNNGIWAQYDNFEETLDETFKNGPICQWHIAHESCTEMQHNFLFNVAIFVKRKYPENWDDALAWVNYNVLKPAGDSDRLAALVKDLKARDYEYRCKDEPICSHCNSGACRRMPYGVGNGRTGIDHYELGMTIIDRVPRIFFVNVGISRVPFSAEELLRVSKYREKCLAYANTFPENMKQGEWDQVIRRAIEEANIIEPPEVLKTNVNEIEILEMYFQLHIPNEIRRGGDEYRAGRVGDNVRVKIEEQSIYFKWKGLMSWCRRALSMRDRELEKLRLFIVEHGREYGKTELRDWYRCTLCIPMKLLDEALVDKWLNGD